jgi:hypothetical protein
VIRALLLALFLGGCSLSLQRIDQTWDGRTAPTCDEGLFPVVVDSLIAAGAGAAAIIEGEKPNQTGDATVVLGGAAVFLVFAISAALGEDATKDCRTAKIAWTAAHGTGNAPSD